MPPQNFMGANCNVTLQYTYTSVHYKIFHSAPGLQAGNILLQHTPSSPQIKGNLDLGRFDLTNFAPLPPQIKRNLDLGRFDLTNFDPSQIKGNLDLGRFDLTNFDPPK